MQHPMRRSIALVTLLTLTSLAACSGGSDATGPKADAVTGVWHMSTINGQRLPFTFQSDAGVLTLTADVITLADGGTWTESTTYVIGGQTQVIADAGTWSSAGTQFSMSGTSFAGYTYTATHSGGNLIVIDPRGVTYVYTR